MKKDLVKLQLIRIPKHCQKPRTRRGTERPTPYTDDRRHRYRGPMLEFSSCKDDSSSITTASMGQGCHASIFKNKKNVPKYSLVRCSISQDEGRKGHLSNSIEVPFTEIESVAQNALLHTCNNRDIGQYKSDHIDTHSTAGPPFTPKKSALQVIGRDNIWVAPGNVVWAKTDNHEWWPAEVKEERAALSSTNQQHVNGQILVQFYGDHEYAWVDPAEDLSHFEDSFEERSCNPMKAFQDALKQALHKREHVNFSDHPNKSYDVLKSSIQDDKSDKWNASSSSRTDDDYLGRGRGKRRRKPKVHFDDITFPAKPAKKVRRLKIMRSLGLMAPLGSPFSHVRTVYKPWRVFAACEP